MEGWKRKDTIPQIVPPVLGAAFMILFSLGVLANDSSRNYVLSPNPKSE
jgi:hypothetical protein